MRDLRDFRQQSVPGTDLGADYGAFVFSSVVDGAPLRVIACSAVGWDHVSVSRVDRCPDWHEMEQIKRSLFKPGETAMQLHVPPAEHINNHETCLHLWRPLHGSIPRPPGELVGKKGVTHEQARALGQGMF